MQKLEIINNSNKKIMLSSSKPFLLGKVGNKANTSANIYSSTGICQNGISVEEISIKEKILPIEGAIYAENKEDLDRKRDYLSSFFNPFKKFTLIYTNNVNKRKIEGRVQAITFKDPIGSFQDYLVQILCPKPFWADVKESKKEIALWEGNFKFPLIIPSDGILMGHRVSNLIVNACNNGDIECGMRIEFKALATVVIPSLYNIYTQKFIKVKRTLSAGDKLIVNTCIGNKKVEIVKSNGTRQNVFNWIDPKTTFFQLQPGDNILRYDAKKGLDNLEMAVYYKQQYLGI